MGVNTETIDSYDVVKNGMINLNFFFLAESANRFPVTTGSRAGRLTADSALVVIILRGHEVLFIFTCCHEM